MNEPVPHKLPGNIFMQPWWLNIVAEDNWYDLRIDKGGDLKARWPLVIQNKKGFLHIEMPVLTQKLGPWLKQVGEKQESRISNERNILEALIEQLPSFDRFSYNLDENVHNHLPFVWNGFRQSSNVTYRLHAPLSEANIWENMKSSVRRDIRRAMETCTVETNVSTEILYEQILKTFSRKDKNVRFSFSIIDKIVREAKMRNRVDVLGIKNNENKFIAAQLFIHDDSITYYLAGGFDESLTEAGAVSLGIFEGIKLASKRLNSFDFEGSSVKGIERFFSSFGSYPIHYHSIKKVSKRYFPIQMVKELKSKYL